MKIHSWARIVALIAACLTGAYADAAPPVYRLTDIGVLPDFTYRAPTDINNNGDVAGYSFDDGSEEGLRPFIWLAGQARLVDLGPAPPGNRWATFGRMNDLGQMVATYQQTRPPFAATAVVLAADADPIVLLLPNDVTDVSLIDIDNAGRILANIAQRSRPDSHAAVWRPGAAAVLAEFAFPHVPVAMNERGWVVGSAITGDPQTDYYLAAIAGSRGRGKVLGTLPFSQFRGQNSDGYAINNLNQVCGSSAAAVRQIKHPFFWSEATGMIDMVPAGGSEKSAACNALNDAGEAVGAGSIYPAFYWTADTGMLDLYGMIDDADPLKTRHPSIYPHAINQSGQVVVTADRDDGTEGASILVLTPQR